MDNLKIYNESREVPTGARKTIQGGRLKGFTDINPMWRIKKLTELFGMVGFGWYYEILEERLEKGVNDETVAFVKIGLHVKYNDEWSKPIIGVGGSSFISKEKSGLYTSDECFKMALTDAISVSCKALGIGADVYWDKDESKYYDKTSIVPQGNQQDKLVCIGDETSQVNTVSTFQPITNSKPLSDAQVKRLYAIARDSGIPEEDVKKVIKKEFNKDSTKDLTREEYDIVCGRMEQRKLSVRQ